MNKADKLTQLDDHPDGPNAFEAMLAKAENLHKAGFFEFAIIQCHITMDYFINAILETNFMPKLNSLRNQDPDIHKRRQSLLPAEQFESESEFLLRIHSGLDLLQDKIDEMANINAFWDIRYEGNRIVERTPKKEVDLHPVIQALLSDYMFLSSIEVYSEYQTGVGNLDFLFTGIVKDKGIAKLCAEFKSAHSADLVKGLEYQLPTYMRNKKVEHGTYCVLDFRGEWFDKPRTDDRVLAAEMGRASSRAKLHAAHPIKVNFLRLGKEDSASKS
jgi:hypothetical protein